MRPVVARALWPQRHSQPRDRTPVGWLANRGLLASVDWHRLVMPGEVGLAMRGGHVYEEFSPDVPQVRSTLVDAHAVDAAGAGRERRKN